MTQTCAYAGKMEASMLLPGLTPSLEKYDAVLPTVGQDSSRGTSELCMSSDPC